MNISFRVLVVSDSRAAGDAVDVAGEKLMNRLHELYPSSHNLMKDIIPDELEDIELKLKEYIIKNVDVVLTTGGTGFCSRDVTPEATRAVIEREAPAIAYAMISKSLAVTDMAMLSRAVCGIGGKTLIINLPGSAKGALECLGFINAAIPHAVNCIHDRKAEVEMDHRSVTKEPTLCPSYNEGSPSKVKVDKVAARKRESPYPMIEVEDAYNAITSYCSRTIDTEVVPFDKSQGRVLAETVYAPEPVPAFRASIKDGYAVIATDGAGIRKIKRKVAAGDKPIEKELQNGEAVRISTGAPVPPGADAVVPVEDTKVIEKSDDDTAEISIRILKAPSVNQDIRDIGSDIPKDSILFTEQTKIKFCHIGILAQLGKTKVKVYKRPSIGILSTGNEIKEPWEQTEPGQVRDSNRYTLMHLLQRYGYGPIDCGIVKDDPNVVKSALEKAFERNDFVITTGGASMGEFDIMKRVLEEDFGAKIVFGRVNMKPGKPTTFALLTYKGNMKKVFCLPGNPASCAVCCLLFVIPTLRYVENEKEFKFPTISASGKLVNTDSRPDYQRVKVAIGNINSQYPIISNTGNQISSSLESMADANGLAVVQPKKNKPTNFQYYTVVLFDSICIDQNINYST